jgi:uncharacterized membrane protein YfhO
MNTESLSQKNAAPRRSRGALYVPLSFLLPMVVLTLAILALHVVPFGTHNLSISDGQFYINNLMNLSRLLRGDGDFLYTFAVGTGSNNWGILSWGGLFPAMFLTLFAQLETMPDLFTWICLVNMSLCGLTMYLLLAGLRGHRPEHLIFSTAYALMGFNVVNCYHYLFFIGPQTLPLVVLGLVYIFRGRSPLLYVLSLGVCGFLNFYFAFMLCVVSVVLFLTHLYIKGPALAGKRLRLFGRWAAASGAGGFLGAPMWLPALKAFASGGGRMEQTTLQEYTFWEEAPFLQIFAKLFSGANSHNEMVTGLPNIFCGILAVALVILYFLNASRPLRRKRAAAVVLILYLITFFLPAFTLLMHGGTHTNWFPYRYSFVFSFFLLLLGVEEFTCLDEWEVKTLKRCGAILAVAVLLVFSVRYEFVSGGAVCLDLALLGIMYLGWRFYKTRPDKAPRRTLTLLLAILVCGNLYGNVVISMLHVQKDGWELDLEEYGKNMMVNGALVDGVKRSDTGFYRLEKDESESGTMGADGTLYGYRGIGGAGPTVRMFIHKGLNRLGINWFDMRHWYAAGVPAATDALLGVKYVISDRDLTEEKGYSRRVTLDDKSLYQSDAALSPAILAEESVMDVTLEKDAFRNLNAVWRAMTGGEKDVLVPQEDLLFTLYTDAAEQSVTAAELRQSLSVSAAEEPEEETDPRRSYFLCTFTAALSGPVYCFDTSVPDSDNGSVSPSVRCVGVFAAGDTVEDRIPVNTGYATGEYLRLCCGNLVYAYGDGETLEEYASALQARSITLERERDSLLRGTFTAEEGQRVLLTIPWDEGWSCLVDGRPVPLEKTWDLFLSFQAPAGTHSYELRFVPAWLNWGLYLCAAAVLILAVLLILHAVHRKRETAPVSPPAEAPEAPEEIPEPEEE